MDPETDRRKRLLWVDGSAGAVVGVLVLALSGWLSGWYGLPRDFVIFMGWANLAYGCYSLTLASRPKRPIAFIWLLIVANLTWAVHCVRWAVVFHESATLLGHAQLLGEAFFVGGLAILEWRWRELLVEA